MTVNLKVVVNQSQREEIITILWLKYSKVGLYLEPVMKMNAKTRLFKRRNQA